MNRFEKILKHLCAADDDASLGTDFIVETKQSIQAAMDLTEDGLHRQENILAWATATFGEVAATPEERALRFIEEALETVQAVGLSRELVLKLVARVYSRPVGNVAEEIGGAGMTLEALAESVKVDAQEQLELMFHRCQTVPRNWAERHEAKRQEGLTADRSQA